MPKSFLKIPKPMAKRVFRRTKSAQLPVMTANACSSNLRGLCSELSQEDIENLSLFRMETNMLRAQTGQNGIEMAEALRYLKACSFNCVRALEIYKNYQKQRETYLLDSLRPHREPLSSGIGSRKMELVGTKDSEGHPIVLFTVSRHETFKSDHKTDMQLLFYTLDQASESEAAKEKGIVFIIDLRESQLSDIRYTSSVLSVLKDSYPIHIKLIYVVSTRRITKVVTAFQKMVKYDLTKMKFVDYSEIGTYFLPEQLPLSLGGTFAPRVASPTHYQQQQQVTRDDSSVSSRQPSQPTVEERRGSDGSRIPRNKEGKGSAVPSSTRDHAPSSSGGKSVNRLLEMFETSNEPQASHKPHPPPSPSKPRPVPPAKGNMSKPTPTPPKKSLSQPSGEPHSQAFQQVVLKKVQHHDTPAEGGGGGEGWNKNSNLKMPLFPPNGRPILPGAGKSDVSKPTRPHAVVAKAVVAKGTEKEEPTDTSLGAVQGKTQGGFVEGKKKKVPTATLR